MEPLFCSTAFHIPAVSGTVPAGGSYTFEIDVAGSKPFALYRFSLGASSFDDLFVDELAIPGKVYLLGGTFQALTGSPSGKVHLSILRDYFHHAQLRRPIVIPAGQRLRLTVNNDGGTDRIVTVRPIGQHLNAVPRDYEYPRFIFGRATIAGSANKARVVLPSEPESRLFDRFMFAADSPDDLRVTTYVGSTPVSESAFVDQIKREFEDFSAVRPWMLGERVVVEFEVTNANVADQEFSVFAEAFPVGAAHGTRALDAASGTMKPGPTIGIGGGPASTGPLPTIKPAPAPVHTKPTVSTAADTARL